MSQTTFIKILERMDHLIRNGSTGNPEEFADRLRISERSLYNYLLVLKEQGAPLFYCRSAESYHYRNSGGFMFEFEKESEQEHAV